VARLTRKELLAGAAVAGVVAGCGGATQRDDGLRHFDAFVLASHPPAVRAAIERHRRGLDADAAGYLHAHEIELNERVAAEAARALNVRAEDVAFTDSTTMGLGLVYGGIRVDGDVVTTEHDFYATHEALRLRFGKVPQIRLYADPARATVDEIVSAVRRGAPRRGLLALTWVHSSTGVRLPLREIAAALPEETLLAVDGVHGLAAVDEPIDAGHVFIAGTHKWLRGPRGTGIVWSRVWDRLQPTIPSFTPGGAAQAFTPGGYHSFEHRWALADAFAAHKPVGARIAALATRLKQGLADIATVRLVTPLDQAVSAGIVCFEVDGLTPTEVVDRLRREHRIAASVTPYRTSYARFGVLGVDEDDVDAAVRAVSRL
jgi:selenocysteine lyase/cysteine desulfurase